MDDPTTFFWTIVLNAFVILFVSVGLNRHYKKLWDAVDVDGDGSDSSTDENGGSGNDGNDKDDCVEDPEKMLEVCRKWMKEIVPESYTVVVDKDNSKYGNLTEAQVKYFLNCLLCSVKRHRRMDNNAFYLLLKDSSLPTSLRLKYYEPTMSFAMVLARFPATSRMVNYLKDFTSPNSPLRDTENELDVNVFRVYSARLVYSVVRARLKQSDRDQLPADKGFADIARFFDTFTLPKAGADTNYEWSGDGYAYDVGRKASGLNALLSVVRYLYMAWSARQIKTDTVDSWSTKANENFKQQVEQAHTRLRLAVSYQYMQTRGSDKYDDWSERRAAILESLVYTTKMMGAKMGDWYIRELAFTAPTKRPFPLLDDPCPIVDGPEADIAWPLLYLSKQENFAIVRGSRTVLEVASEPRVEQESSFVSTPAETWERGYINFGCDFGPLIRFYRSSLAEVPFLLGGQISFGGRTYVPEMADFKLSSSTDKHLYTGVLYKSFIIMSVNFNLTSNTSMFFVRPNTFKKFALTLFTWFSANKLAYTEKKTEINLFEYNRTITVSSSSGEISMTVHEIGTLGYVYTISTNVSDIFTYTISSSHAVKRME